MGNYVNNHLEGEYKTYYDNGLLKSEEFINNGLPDGKKTTYHRNGAIERLENYINGKLEGWIKTYFSDGTMMKEEFYKDGRIQRRKEYSREGLLISTFGYN
jgi:antitoxin component YwqK of YwqJK toxin-antitoxin module